ncbi:8451_t:CDS:1, partial [Rhizophagus irregularis]
PLSSPTRANAQAIGSILGGCPCPIPIPIAYDVGNSFGAVNFCVVENAVPALIGHVTPDNEQISTIRGSPMGCFATTSMNVIPRKSPATMSFFIVPLMTNVSSVPATIGSGVTVTSSPTTSGGKPGHG